MKSFAVLSIGLATIVMPAFAHHSFSAEFDSKKLVILTGTVTKVEWLNPHVYFYLDVKDTDGKVTNWELESGSPSVMMRRGGWTRNSLKIGDVITVEGHLAKDGSNLAYSQTVKLANGTRLFASSTEDDNPGHESSDTEFHAPKGK